MKEYDRRQFLRVAGLGAASVMMPCHSNGGESPHIKPNMIFFLGDDHSVWDAGCYGNKVVRTPNLDRLASEGMRFDRAFTSTAMCAPARSMLYTGLYPHRNGCHMNHGATRQEVKSLPHYLKPLGYRVVLAGKKHIKPKSVYPFEYIEQKDIKKVIFGKDPFCLVIASNEPHSPHKQGGYRPEEVPIPPYLPDTPAIRGGIANYYTDIDILEKELGHTLNLLKRSGRQDNTLFIYAGDHGSGLMAKWTCYETGLRVPFVARWPGRIKAGAVTKAMVSFVDILPTFLDAVGARKPEDIDGQSFLSVLTGNTKEHRSLIFGAHTNHGIISGEPYPVRSVRDLRYKYIRNLNPDGRPTNGITFGRDYTEMTTGLWAEWKSKALTDTDAARLLARVMNRSVEELYDLTQDPWELKNLASDPLHAETKVRLSRELDLWMQQQGDRGMGAELDVHPHKSMRGIK
jgi:N-sulfoglucosamine sulfohydrolase